MLVICFFRDSKAAARKYDEYPMVKCGYPLLLKKVSAPTIRKVWESNQHNNS